MGYFMVIQKSLKQKRMNWTCSKEDTAKTRLPPSFPKRKEERVGNWYGDVRMFSSKAIKTWVRFLVKSHVNEYEIVF